MRGDMINKLFHRWDIERATGVLCVGLLISVLTPGASKAEWFRHTDTVMTTDVRIEF